MRLEKFLRIALAISRKDWDENRYPILVLSAGLSIASSVMAADSASPFARGMMFGLVSCAGYLFGQGCFANERRMGALEMLLALPVSPRGLVLAKFCSCFSMTFLVITIPSLIHHDVLIIYRSNAFALFAAAVFMVSTVISEKPWAPQVPFWMLMLLLSPFRRIPLQYLTIHPDFAAAVMLALIVPMVLMSAEVFQRRQSA